MPQCTGACPCNSNADCASAQTCVGGLCSSAQTCTVDGDCGDPSLSCLAGVCTPSARPAAGDGGHAIPDGGHLDGGRSDGGFDAGLDGGRDGGSDGGSLDAGPDAGPDAGCTADSQCAPPAMVCTAGSCVTGCLPGGCGLNQFCDTYGTGRCVAASGAGGPGSVCTSDSQCAPQALSSYGLCVTLGADAGAVCSSLCVATSECPAGEVCALLGAIGVCLSPAAAGYAPGQVGTGAIDSTCTSYTSCDSIAPASCAAFDTAKSPTTVCTDTCAGKGLGCPTGWSCLTIGIFYVSDAGPTCTSNAVCDFNSGCYTTALGGDGKCHQEQYSDECVSFGQLAGSAAGATCTVDSDCAYNWCFNGVCTAPCCVSADCQSGQACGPLGGPSYSLQNGCVAATGTQPLGAACTTTAAASCRSGVCLASDPYVASSTAGYCSDTCCSDAQCGAGYTCGLSPVGGADGGFVGYAGLCYKL